MHSIQSNGYELVRTLYMFCDLKLFFIIVVSLLLYIWYEEVVHRESIFYTVLNYYNNFNENKADKRGKTDKSAFDKQMNKFETKLLNDDIQIGANASIGYGICNFKKIGVSDE